MSRSTVAVSLSIEAIAKLERMCEANDRGRSQMVDRIILEAKER